MTGLDKRQEEEKKSLNRMKTDLCWLLRAFVWEATAQDKLALTLGYKKLKNPLIIFCEAKNTSITWNSRGLYNLKFDRTGPGTALTNLRINSISLIVTLSRLEMIWHKHSSLLGPFVSYEKNEVLWIRTLCSVQIKLIVVRRLPT
jgi:hypothetical protein